MQHSDYEMDWLRGDDDGYVGQPASPSLLPTVLHQLGLDSPSVTLADSALPLPSIQEEHALAALGDAPRDTLPGGQVMWIMRAEAVRTLGKLGEQAPLESLEFLLAALEDEHEMVRATAVHAAGLLGERVPLEKIIAALHDPHWHVREVAALTLGELGECERVPPEPLIAALEDTVAPVREAARAALQQAHPDGAFESLSPSVQSSNGVAHSFPLPSQTRIW